MRVLSQSKPSTHDLFCEKCVKKPIYSVSYKTHMSSLFSIEFVNTNENINQDKASQLELIEFMNATNTTTRNRFYSIQEYCKPKFQPD